MTSTLVRCDGCRIAYPPELLRPFEQEGRHIERVAHACGICVLRWLNSAHGPRRRRFRTPERERLRAAAWEFRRALVDPMGCTRHTVSAWRLGHNRHGDQVRRIVVRTPDWPSMYRWLSRSRAYRDGRDATRNLWIEDEAFPAVTVAPSRYRKNLDNLRKPRTANPATEDTA